MSMDIDANRPKLGEAGERCAGCGVPLAEDQRYCLNCGQRRGNARIPFLDVMRSEWEAQHRQEETEQAEAVAEASRGDERNWGPIVAASVGAGMALVLGLGFLIGQSGDDAPANAGRPQVVQVGGGGTAPAAAVAFQSDWPDGQEGWTVQLAALPKASTQAAQVATAKTDAQGKGAPDVGALDSDQIDGLDPGQYIVYSGVFNDEKAAKKALGKVKKNFPDAKVIQIGASSGGGGDGVSGKGGDKDALSGKKKEATVDRSQLNALQNLSPEEYQKKSRKLPETTILPGKPPPKDNRAPGGGSGGEEIP
jgi:hypothetical protein